MTPWQPAAAMAAAVVAVVALDRPAVTKFMPGASSPTAAVMSAAASHLRRQPPAAHLVGMGIA